MTVAVGPGPESVAVELYAPAPTSSRWDLASWDGGSWGAPSWQVVGCDVVEASYVRGVTDEAGVLSQSAAGPMDLATLDPNRELDPSNAGGPYFGSIAPGTPIRLRGGAAGAMVGVWTGYIDEATHDVAIQRGRVRCVDAIALLAQANVPDGTVLPNTLRARVRAIVAAAGLGIPVQPDLQTVQLVANPGFEAGLSPWVAQAAGAGSGVYAQAGAVEGANVLRIVGGGSPARYYQTVPVVAGQTYSAEVTAFRSALFDWIVNGSFAAGMASWPVYSGPAGSAGSADPTVGTYGRWQGAGTGPEVQAVQTVAGVVEGATYTFSAQLYGTGWANHPTVLQVDARGTGATLFSVVNLQRVAAGYALMTGTYTVPIGQGINNLTVRVGIGQTDGSNATSSMVAYASAITCTAPTSAAPRLALVPRDASGALVGSAPAAAGVRLDAWEHLTVAYTAPADGSAATVEVELALSGVSVATDRATFDAAYLWGPDPASILGVDPPVAPFDGKSVAAWTAIQNAALDALVLVWLDPVGTLRFTSWGGLPDASVSIGCPPAGESAAAWIGGLSTVVYGMSASAIRNRVRAYSSGTIWTPYVDDAAGIAKYGARPLDVDRIVPSFATWSARILADRADAGLSVTLGEVRPYSLAELVALLNIGATGPQVVRVADSEHGTPIDDSVGIVGTQGRMTAAGWSFRYVTMIPRADWDAVQPPPITPPTPPGGTYHQETRTYVVSSDALLALTSGGSKYGAGASSSLPVGVWQGWTYRAALQLPAIPWTGIRRIVSASLHLRTTSQVRLGFGSSPTIEVQRITGSWSAGSASSPSSGNAVVYPGPTTTTAGAKRADVPTAQNADTSIDITAIATAWAPGSIGGTAAPQRGVMLLPGSGSGVDTTEVWPTEQGGAARPSLVLVVEVYD